MKVLIVLVVLMSIVDLNEGCIAGRSKRKPRRTNQKFVRPTTAEQIETTQGTTTEIPEVFTTEQAIQTENATIAVKPTTAEQVETTQNTRIIERLTVSTTETPEVVTRSETKPSTLAARIETQEAIRLPPLFNFRTKTFGRRRVPSTRTCADQDVNGICRDLEVHPCLPSEFVRGKFNCPGRMFCCVPR